LQKTITRKRTRTEIYSDRKSARLKNRPEVTYPADLPICSRKDDIVQAIVRHPVVIITGETGSGKTTQLPKMCLEAGRGMSGIIGCTQPRRVAAVTVAERIAEELGQTVGQAVGYKIRFEDRSGPSPFIRLMTDGILLMESQRDPLLRAYDTIIVDEAHERNLNIDFLLGYLKTLLQRRRDLKIVITSATIDTEKFSSAFGGAPVVEVTGRVYPVEVLYRPIEPEDEDSEDLSPVDAAVRAVDELRTGQYHRGDILIFMPTEQDIRDTCELLEGRSYDNLVVLPLFARLSWSEQRRVFSPANARKIVVATNIAETSLTIPGIRYVIDSGTARISRYNPRTRTISLAVQAISRSSADQRKGRCGRVQNGVCIRLYSEEDYLRRPLYTVPEILRSNLAEVILRMLKLGLGHPSSFPFIDAPNLKSIRDGFDVLKELGAVTIEKKRKGDNTEDEGFGVGLTEKGRRMARMPMDPRISRILLEAKKEGCLKEATIIASGLCVQDPRERPADDEGRADLAHRRFVDPASDFLTLLRIWQAYENNLERLKSSTKMRKFCRTHYLSWRRMREWKEIYEQVRTILKEGGEEKGENEIDVESGQKDLYAALHRSILSGYLSGIACRREKNFYAATRGREVMLYPGSGLFHHGGDWIVAAEMVETSRLFARTAANIDSSWIEQIAGELCTSTYSEPHWEKRREEVVAFEQVSLFGLVIVPRRRVSYAAVDPEESNRIFIRSALVDGELKTLPPFLHANCQLIAEVMQMEDKIRRRNLLQDDAVLESFYASRLPGVCDMRTLKSRIRDQGGDAFLRMSLADVLSQVPDEDELSLYPDQVDVEGRKYRCVYRFDPGREDDGVTIQIPDALLPGIPPGSADWMIPGMLKNRVLALLRGLPKEYRKKLHPLGPTADSLIRNLTEPSGPLIPELAGLIRTTLSLDIPAAAWSKSEVPDYLRVRFAVLDGKNHEKASGRDLAVLQQSVNAGKDSKALERTRRIWEKTGFTAWNFGDLPDSVEVSHDGSPAGLAWPALTPAEGCVDLCLYKTRKEAAMVHPKGVAALYSIYFSRELKDLRKALQLPKPLKSWAEDFGGARKVESLFLDKVKKDLFELEIRKEGEFLDHARKIREKLLMYGQDLIKAVEPLLKAYSETAADLRQLELSVRGNREGQAFLKQLRCELEELLPGDFLLRWEEKRLKHIPRYLKALKIRADRGFLNREKDRRREEELQPFIHRLKEALDGLSEHASDKKRQALDDFSQMVEEYKVSLFAQELKTAFPVSARRLEEKLNEIDRMF